MFWIATAAIVVKTCDVTSRWDHPVLVPTIALMLGSLLLAWHLVASVRFVVLARHLVAPLVRRCFVFAPYWLGLLKHQVRPMVLRWAQYWFQG